MVIEYINGMKNLKDYQKEYYQKNKQKALQQNKLWRISNKEHVKEYKKQLRLKNREKALVRQYRHKDLKLGLVCDLTSEWMKENITSKQCTYCGDTKNLGCDRIDNSKGHTMDNCIPCCLICNKVRMDEFNIDEMKLLGVVINQIKNNRLI